MNKPCEKCGHCPSCGRGGYNVYPYWQYIPPAPNTWPGYSPYYGTFTVTSSNTGTLVN